MPRGDGVLRALAANSWWPTLMVMWPRWAVSGQRPGCQDALRFCESGFIRLDVAEAWVGRS